MNNFNNRIEVWDIVLPYSSTIAVLMPLEHPILMSLEHPILMSLDPPFLMSLEHPILMSLELSFALFSEHLSAPKNYKTLIHSKLQSHTDSDRCFSTFIFYSHALMYSPKRPRHHGGS